MEFTLLSEGVRIELSRASASEALGCALVPGISNLVMALSFNLPGSRHLFHLLPRASFSCL